MYKMWTSSGTFEFLQSISAEDIDPHGSELFLPEVNLLQGPFVLGQLVQQGLRLRTEGVGNVRSVEPPQHPKQRI